MRILMLLKKAVKMNALVALSCLVHDGKEGGLCPVILRIARWFRQI